jgi:hypothetical protein
VHRAALVGNERRWDITFDSGPVHDGRQAHGARIAVDPPQVEAILARVKDEIRRQRRVLRDDEVRAIAERVRAEFQPARWRILAGLHRNLTARILAPCPSL